MDPIFVLILGVKRSELDDQRNLFSCRREQQSVNVPVVLLKVLDKSADLEFNEHKASNK